MGQPHDRKLMISTKYWNLASGTAECFCSHCLYWEPWARRRNPSSLAFLRKHARNDSDKFVREKLRC